MELEDVPDGFLADRHPDAAIRDIAEKFGHGTAEAIVFPDVRLDHHGVTRPPKELLDPGKRFAVDPQLGDRKPVDAADGHTAAQHHLHPHPVEHPPSMNPSLATPAENVEQSAAEHRPHRPTTQKRLPMPKIRGKADEDDSGNGQDQEQERIPADL